MFKLTFRPDHSEGADHMLAAKVRNRNPGLMLLQYPDKLLFAKTLALHSLVLSKGQS